MAWLSESNGRVVLAIHAVPRASRNRVEGLHGEALKVRLQAPPVDGKANDALIRFLAEVLGVPARQVSLVAGATGRQKRVAIEGLCAAEARRRLGVIRN